MRNDSRELLAVGIGGRASLGDRMEVLLKRGREFSPRVSLLRLAASAIVLLVCLIAGSRAPRWIAFAQDRPSFEVASIKPGDPDSRQVSLMMQPGGRLVATNVGVQMLIGFAYDVRNHQISAIPKPLDSAKFTIEARAGANSPPPSPAGAPTFRLMLQSLLAERFKLVVHRETREEQIYELVIDKGGPKLKPAAETAKGSPQGIRGGGRGELQGMSAPLPLLVNLLSQQLGRSVIDKTGLDGRYDFTLKWTPDPGAGPPPPGAPEGPSSDPNGPSLFTALQEQLGLKLQSAKGPVEMIMIDHVEKADAN